MCYGMLEHVCIQAGACVYTKYVYIYICFYMTYGYLQDILKENC